MDVGSVGTEAREERVNEVLAAYLAAVEAGDNPDPRPWLDRHPELKDELASFFAAKEGFEREANPLLPTAGGSATGEPVQGEAAALGDYLLLEEIARGGMGIVYRAWQKSLGRLVAVKTIRAGQLASDEDVRRFRAEAELAAGLDHPGIIPIYEVGQHGGQHFFSMRLIEGESLGQYLAREHAALGGKDGQRRVVGLLSQVARAIHHAHQRGILHRDLKPSNILLDEQGQPHVTDFGLAKRLDRSTELTASHAIIGSVPYMAPEQAGGQVRQLTTACDVWALGVILYQCLTGRLPFEGQTALATLRQIQDATFPRPRQVSPALPRDLETILLKCLQREPADRYGTAAALADDLDRYLAGEPIEARSARPLARLWLWSRRQPVLAGVTAALVFLLVSAAVAGTLVAVSMGELADRERAAAQTAGDAADAAETRRKQAEEERDARIRALAAVAAERDAKEKALQRAEGLRLTALSEVVRATDPGLALALAVEGGLKQSSLLGHHALVESLEACREVRTLLLHGDDSLREEMMLMSEGGERLIRVPSGRGGCNSAEFSGDGTRILTVCGDNVARLWDANTGQLLREYSCPPRSPTWSYLVQAHLSADGRRVLTVNDRSYQRDGGGMSGDGLSCADDIVRLWDAQTGKVLATYHLWSAKDVKPVMRLHRIEVSFSPDGRQFALSSGDAADPTAHLYSATTGKELFKLVGHELPILHLAWSADSKRLATASLDQTAGVWDASSGKRLRTLKGHRSGVHFAAFSPDGRRLVTTGNGASMTKRNGAWTGHSGSDTEEKALAFVWDVETGKEVQRFKLSWPQQAQARLVCFSPDGEKVLTAGLVGSRGISEQSACPTIWRVDTGEAFTRLASAPREDFQRGAYAAAFSPDGWRVAVVGSDSVVRFWDSITGKELLALRGHQHAVLSVAFSPDGNRLLTASYDGTARLWDIRPSRGSPPWAPRWQSKRLGSFSGDGRLLYLPPGSRSERYGRVIETATGKEMARLEGRWPWSLGEDRVEGQELFWGKLSPDGARLLTSPSPSATLKLRDPRTLRVIATLGGHQDTTVFRAFSPDGKRIITCDGKDGRLWDAATGKLLSVLRGERDLHVLNRAVFSADGKLLVSLGGPVNQPSTMNAYWPPIATSFLPNARVWDAETGKPLAILRGHWVYPKPPPQKAPSAPPVAPLPPPPDGVPTGNGPALPVMPPPPELHDGHSAPVVAAAISKDGKLIATASEDQTIRLWDARTGKHLRVLTGHTDHTVGCVAFSPDGKWLLSGGFDTTARLWDVHTGKAVRVLRNLPGEVRQVAFSPEGTLFLTVAGDTVRLWDTETGRAVAQYREESLTAYSASFSTDGRSVLTQWTGSHRDVRVVARLWPVDLAPVAARYRPRPLVAAERERYEIEGAGVSGENTRR